MAAVPINDEECFQIREVVHRSNLYSKEDRVASTGGETEDV